MVELRSPSGLSAEPGRRPAQRRSIGCHLVRSEAELATHLAIRRQVFVAEQHVFADDDRDEHDSDVSTLHVLGLCDATAGGTVRLYRSAEEGCWVGDRLAVLPAFRRFGLGKPLVNFAVATAGRLGGTLMVAHVQLANVAFFERLGWHRTGAPADYVGLAHQAMAIELATPDGAR